MKPPKRTYQDNYCNVRVRTPDLPTLQRWKAAAAADGRSLNAWINRLANAASLPVLKKTLRRA